MKNNVGKILLIEKLGVYIKLLFWAKAHNLINF